MSNEQLKQILNTTAPADLDFEGILALMLACENLIDENDRYREALEKISCPTSMWDGFNAKMYWDIAHEALKGGE